MPPCLSRLACQSSVQMVDRKKKRDVVATRTETKADGSFSVD
jgi:hypothetical protein